MDDIIVHRIFPLIQDNYQDFISACVAFNYLKSRFSEMRLNISLIDALETNQKVIVEILLKNESAIHDKKKGALQRQI